jgi:hypothetical protein
LLFEIRIKTKLRLPLSLAGSRKGWNTSLYNPLLHVAWKYFLLKEKKSRKAWTLCTLRSLDFSSNVCHLYLELTIANGYFKNRLVQYGKTS